MAVAVFAAAMVQQAACDAAGDTADGAGSHLVPAVQPVQATPDWHKPAQVHASIKAADEALVDKDPHNDFGSGFFASLTMILVTEIGDRTFFIAAIMAMKHSRGVVLAGALSALALMTVLSAALGYVVPNVIRPAYARMLATICFGYFGVTLLRDARSMDATDLLEEVEEVRTELEKKDLEDGDKGDGVAGVSQ